MMKRIEDIVSCNSLVASGPLMGMPYYKADFRYIQDIRYRGYLEAEAEKYMRKILKIQLQNGKDSV